VTIESQPELTPVNAWLPGHKAPWAGRHAPRPAAEREWLSNVQDMLEDEFWELAEKVWDYTLNLIVGLYNLYHSCRYVIDNKIDGDIVECGVFLGGNVMFMAEVFRRHDYSLDRRILGFDTFHGFVRRSEHDIDLKGNEVCQPNDPSWNFLKVARANVESVGYDPMRLFLIEGDVLQTLPLAIDRPIALLRLDTDTYDTTKFELEQCWPNIVKGAPVIIDDYGWCLGARKATDDFINGRNVLLQRICATIRCFVKP
jgi:hypothetical protein